MLATDRRRSFGMREEQHEQDPWQGSLFGAESLAPPARPPGRTPDPFARSAPVAGASSQSGTASRGRAEAVDAARLHAEAASASAAPAAADLLAPAPEPAEVIEPADYLDDPEELEPAHADHAGARSLLTGPTLDDIMSRAWEGLRAEVPTPCPVCRTEIEPSAGGRCGACGSTLD